MVTLLVAAALSLPIPEHHLSVHVGHSANVAVHATTRIRGWSQSPALVEVHSRWTKKTQVGFTVTGLYPGITAFTVSCDSGAQERWIIEVQP